MTVSELKDTLSLTPVTLPEGDREAEGVYIGDLLSWVMGRAQADNVWLTIMSNLNIVAVATLADVSCIILCEGVTLEESVRNTAEAKGVNILATEAPAYETMLTYVNAIGLDIHEFEKFYGEKTLHDAILYAKDLKDRYSVLWMYYDLLVS